MTDAFSLATVNPQGFQEVAPEEPQPQRLVVVPAPQREVRPLSELARVFGQFADLHHQIAGHVAELETSLHDQRKDVAAAAEQVPELRERINWLISSVYEQSKKEEIVEGRLAAQEASLAAVTDTVRGLCDAHTHWNAALDEVIDLLLRARAMSVSALPTLDH